MNPKLKDMFKEPEFWLLFIISIPGLVAGMAESMRAAYDAIAGNPIHYDASAAYAMLTGLPLVGYIGLGRQIARSGAAKGVGIMMAGEAGAMVQASNPPAEATTPMPPPENHEEAPVAPMGVVPAESPEGEV